MNEIHEPKKQIEDFPPEIFHLIFDYLTGDEILRIFLPLNQRFSHLISNLRLNTIDLTQWTRRELTDFFKHSFLYLSTYSLSLKLSNFDIRSNSCSANIEFLFSSLIDLNQSKYLINNLEQLIFLRPLIDIHICLLEYLLQSFHIYLFSNKIIFQKSSRLKKPFSHLSIGSHEILRSILIDQCQISEQIFIDYQNRFLTNIIFQIKHLKFYIDNYHQQWNFLSSLITDYLIELTILIYDTKFEYYNGETLSLVLRNLSSNCRLNFYFQLIPNQIYSRRDIDLIYQSYQIDFYRQHQSNITINYSRNSQLDYHYQLIIYTSPFSSSKLLLINNQEILGNCSDYTNLTRLILDPCFPNTFQLNTQLNFLPNLTSLELIHTSSYHFHQRFSSINHLFRQISSHLRHLHIHHVQCSSFLIRTIFPFHTFPCLRYLDITDNDKNCLILSDILKDKNLCRTLFHLNIFGLCRLNNIHIQEISRKCTNLQILKFSMKFYSTFNDQLDTIGLCILINMRTYLRYVHIDFDQENLLIMSMIPSESQLSEWLGHNQKRLVHVQAIELNRSELSAWM